MLHFNSLMMLVAVGHLVLADDCPSGTCDDTQTCCDGPYPGSLSCCPEPNAVCCTDGLHCCPAHTVCNLGQGTCDRPKSNKLIPVVFRNRPQVQLSKANSKDLVVYCPGGQYYCPDENTCCRLTSGRYGCCPLPSAVCCSDGVHCCPRNTFCAGDACVGVTGSFRFNALLKQPAVETIPMD